MRESKKIASELQDVVNQLRRSSLLKHDHSGLRGAEKHMLILISELKDGEPVTISEIANKIGVTLAAVTHQINALEKENLIKRLSRSEDRRIVLVKLSKKGNLQVKDLQKKFAQKIQMLSDFLGEKDTKTLIRLMKKISGLISSSKEKQC